MFKPYHADEIVSPGKPIHQFISMLPSTIDQIYCKPGIDYSASSVRHHIDPRWHNILSPDAVDPVQPLRASQDMIKVAVA